MPQQLQHRVAVVTGASSGVGAAIARAFAEEGARVIAAARRRDRLDALAADFPDTVLACPTDVTQEEEVQALFRAAEAFAPVDLLVNCAGAAIAVETAEMTLAAWRRIVDLNLTGSFLCAREALRLMVPRRRGRIINIGSISGLVPRAESLAYTATKFGIEGMTRSLALDYRGHGITVSVLRPGATVSELAGVPRHPLEAGADLMDGATVARAAVTMAMLPDDANMLEATVLPIAQPFLGRG